MVKRKKDISWLQDDEDTITMGTVDMNGIPLQDGDTVIASKDFKVKSASNIKRGDIFKNIRLTDDHELIESGKMVLRTEFFKKK